MNSKSGLLRFIMQFFKVEWTVESMIFNDVIDDE